MSKESVMLVSDRTLSPEELAAIDQDTEEKEVPWRQLFEQIVGTLGTNSPTIHQHCRQYGGRMGYFVLTFTSMEAFVLGQTEKDCIKGTRSPQAPEFNQDLQENPQFHTFLCEAEKEHETKFSFIVALKDKAQEHKSVCGVMQRDRAHALKTKQFLK